MDDRYITKKQALSAMRKATNCTWDDIWNVESVLNNVPAADVASVVHGSWKIVKEAPIGREFIPFNEVTELDLQNKCQCSRCGFTCGIGVGQSHFANYCPYCGARMDGGE